MLYNCKCKRNLQKQSNMPIKDSKYNYSTPFCRNRISIIYREFLCPDIQRIESVCSVRAMLKQVLFRLFQLHN